MENIKEVTWLTQICSNTHYIIKASKLKQDQTLLQPHYFSTWVVIWISTVKDTTLIIHNTIPSTWVNPLRPRHWPPVIQSFPKNVIWSRSYRTLIVILSEGDTSAYRIRRIPSLSSSAAVLPKHKRINLMEDYTSLKCACNQILNISLAVN